MAAIEPAGDLESAGAMYASIGGVSHEPALAASSGAGDRLARIVSNVCSPPVLTLPAFVIAARAEQSGEAWRYVLLYAVVAVLIPVADLIWQLRTGRVSDMHLPHRHERIRSFVVGTLAAAAGLAMLMALAAPPLIVALALVVVVQSLLLFGITLRWQVSVHGAAVASLATIGTLLMWPLASSLMFLVPVVAWARLRLNRHTPAQVAVGVAIGGMVPFLVLNGLLGRV